MLVKHGTSACDVIERHNSEPQGTATFPVCCRACKGAKWVPRSHSRAVLAATDVQSAVRSALQAVGSSVAEETAAGAAALLMPKPTFRPRATATAGKRGADGKAVNARRAQAGALCAGAEEAEQEAQQDTAAEGGAAADGGGGGPAKRRGRFRKKVVSFADSS